MSQGTTPPGPLDKKIASVTLLGSTAKLAYTHDTDGLHVTLPATAPSEAACALKLTLE